MTGVVLMPTLGGPTAELEPTMTLLPEPRILRYTRWLARERGLHFDPTTTAGYDALWRWSVADLDAFWGSIWDHFELRSPTPWTQVLVDPVMPGARWFPGARLNYAAHLFSHAEANGSAQQPAIVFQSERLRERGELHTLGWAELRRQVGALAAAYVRMGVEPGDRVCAFLPNVPQTVVAFLACASIGAVWSVCSPDMGPVAVLDRFRQIEPSVFIGCDGYVYGGAAHDRQALLVELLDALPSVRHAVLLRCLDPQSDPARLASAQRDAHDFDALVADSETAAPVWLDFDHPLWIVYSSGTTGLPKPIVHGHGGVMLEALKMGGLHNNLGRSAETGERYFWISSTGWIMWNSQVGALLGGTTVAMFDGSPSGRQGQADWTTLWRFAADAGVTFFGAGAAFYASCLKADVRPTERADLSRLRAIGSTGSPLAIDCYRWVHERLPQVNGRPIWLTAIAGGTDFAGAFVGGLPTLPVVDGEMQCRCLGAAVEAWGEPDASGRGRSLVDDVGELVCTQPMPSMPLYFWGDAPMQSSGGTAAGAPAKVSPGVGQRYHDSYFDMYPGVWRHGDWIRITERGGAIIYGRSDATINRHGIRMGTSELYRAVEALPEVLDSLVVDLEYLGRESYMPLFVVLREGMMLDATLTGRIKHEIRHALSARHVPNEIFQVSAVPRTLSGKKMELPVKKLLLGTPAEQVFKLDAMANADCVAWFVAFAARRAANPPV